MSNKSLVVLSGILLVIIGLVAAKLYLPQLLQTPSAYQQSLKGLTPQTVTSIKIVKGQESVTLTKDGETWKSGGKKANAGQVTQILDQVIPKSSPKVIAQSQVRQSEFDLTTEQATSLQLNNDKKILLGKTGTDGQYARFDNDNNIFLLKINTPVSAQVADWYDKTILAFDQMKLTKISFSISNEAVVLIRKDTTWRVEKTGQEAKKDNIDTLLANLSKLTAEALATEADVQGFLQTPANTLILEGDSFKETITLSPGENDYLVARQSDGERFLLAKQLGDTLISLAKSF